MGAHHFAAVWQGGEYRTEATFLAFGDDIPVRKVTLNPGDILVTELDGNDALPPADRPPAPHAGRRWALRPGDDGFEAVAARLAND